MACTRAATSRWSASDPVPPRSLFSADDPGLVDYPQPGAVRLAPGDLGGCTAREPCGGKRQVPEPQRGLALAGNRRAPVEEPLQRLPNRLRARRLSTTGDGEHGAGFVQRHQPLDVPRVATLHKEPPQLLRLRRSLVPLVSAHVW